MSTEPSDPPHADRSERGARHGPPASRRHRSPGPTALLALYPEAWRRRYGDELDALILDMHADGRAPTWRVYADLVRSAIRERLRGGTGDPRQRIRGGASLVLWSWTVFVLAGAIVAKTSEHWQRALPAHLHAGADAAFTGLTALALATGGLVVAGIVMASPAAARQIRGGGWIRVRWRVLTATTLTVFGAASTAALARWGHGLTVADRNGHDAWYGAAFVCWAALIATCLLAWTAVATKLAREISLRRPILRAQALAAPLIAIGMAAMTAATIVWWAITGHADAAALTGGAAAAHPSALVPQLAVAVALMLVSTAIAGLGAVRAGGALTEL